MALIVSGSKYDELLKENKKTTNDLNSVLREVKQLQEENKKISSLKDRYALNAETLQKENDDLKATLSLVREELCRMQTEFSHLKTQSSQDVKEDVVIKDDVVPLEVVSQPELSLETAKAFLLNYDVSTLKDFFDEVIDRKTNEEKVEQKRKHYILKMLTILNSVVEYAHKETKLLNLVKLSDPSAPTDDIKEMIENTKAYHIKQRDAFYSNTFNYSLLRAPKRPDESMHSFLVRSLKFEKEYCDALSIYKEGVSKDEWNDPFNLNILKTFLKFKKILPANTDEDQLKKDIERV